MLKSIIKFFFYVFLSLLLALFIRLFLCNFYSVPSDSMTPAVMSGDFILTNKWTYGARIYTSLKFGKYDDPPMVRTQGLREVCRGDVVVFNFPYRQYQVAWDTICMNMNMFVVKRCIGLPGDSLLVTGGYYHISGIVDTLGYIVEQKRLAHYTCDIDTIMFRTFPFEREFNWNILNFGPLYIPAAGATIPLTVANFKLFRKQMAYETKAVIQMKNSSIYINDTLATSYTFRYNWYFMAGDNVMNSQDSRYIGLIPETYIVGKAVFILFSLDPQATWYKRFRWSRFISKIV